MVGIDRDIVPIELSEFLGKQSRCEMFAHTGEVHHRVWIGTFDKDGFEMRDPFRFMPQFISGIGVSAIDKGRGPILHDKSCR